MRKWVTLISVAAMLAAVGADYAGADSVLRRLTPKDLKYQVGNFDRPSQTGGSTVSRPGFTPVNVLAFGVDNTGATDCADSLQAVIDSVEAWGGGVVYLPAGTYSIEDSISVGDYVLFQGDGKKSTTIQRDFTGNLFYEFGSFSGMRDLTIDGQTATYGNGRGIYIGGSKPGQTFYNVEIKNFNYPCITFAADGGSAFNATGCYFYTTGAAASVGAITVGGNDTQATPRHFVSCESGGCTLFDFGGTNNFFVSGGYTGGLIYGASATKVAITNMRIGSAADSVIVRGTSNTISSSVSAVPFRLAGQGHKIDCEVPDWSITDNSTASLVTQRLVSYTPSWTSTGTAPALGDGSITGHYTRDGALVTVFITLSYGSTTTSGTGNWQFSLPLDDNASIVCESGNGHTSGGTSNFSLIPQVSPGNQLVTLFSTDPTAGTLVNVGGASTTWSSSTVVRFSVQYFTN